MNMTEVEYMILIRIDFYDFASVLVSIEKIYQTLKTLFDQISKLEFSSKNTSLRVVLSTLPSVFGNVVTTRSLVFDKITYTTAAQEWLSHEYRM